MRDVSQRQMAVERSEAQEAQEEEAPETCEGEPEVPDVQVLTLNHGEHQDATLYRYV